MRHHRYGRPIACALALALSPILLAQTETEPNNSSAQATVVVFNAAMSGNSGTCAPTDNSVDYFNVTIPGQGVLRLQTSMSNSGPADLPVTVRVHNSAATIIETFTATAGANGVVQNNTFLHLCAGAGTYYISIANPSTTVCTDYSFTPDLLAPDFANDNEPNQSTAQATDTLDAGVDQEGRINFRYGDNSDHFRILAPTDGVVTITVAAEHAGTVPGTMDLNLRNSSGSVLQTWTVSVGANGVPATNTFTRSCTGTKTHYFLELEGLDVCGASYRINYSVAAPLFGDDAEPNQNTVQAVVANANTPYDGRVEFEYDNNFDYFRLQSPNDGVLHVTMLAEHAGPTAGTVTVRLRNNAGSVIETWTANVGANGSATLNTFSHTCTGTEAVYYLEVDDPNVCGVSYQFSYSTASPLFGDDLEPNQSTTQAIVAAANTDHEGRLGFEYDNGFDYFRIQAPNDGVMTVTFSAEHAGTTTTDSLDLYLRNNAGSVLEVWRVGVGANGTANVQTFTRRCIGTEAVYYLEPAATGACGVSYRFSYSVAQPLYADDAEPNQGIPDATIAAAGINHEGRLDFDYDNDYDYFRIQAPNDGVLNVGILAEYAGPVAGTMDLYLRNSSGSVLVIWPVNVGANGIPSANSFTWNCTGTEAVYFLEPYSPGLCGVSYRFNYTVAAPLYADDSEPNQNTAQATDIDLNMAPAHGRLTFNYDNDYDYFRVEHPGGPLQVITRAENAGAPGTMSVYIRNSAGSVLVLNADVSVGGNGIAVADTTVTPGSVAAGTYYIEPYSPTLCGVSYRFDCYDDDNDGVCNSSDLCAGTPTGEGVNSNGCSCSQVVVDDGNICTLDACTNGTVSNTFQDIDGDLTCDANDGCPNDPNKIAPGQCGCGAVDTDSDNDGLANCVDPCPGLAGLQNGDACNDGNPNTINDTVTGCICAGTLLANDCEGTPGGAALPGTACNDNDALTENDTWSAQCICAGTPIVVYECPALEANIGDACDDLDASTANDTINGQCVCIGTPIVVYDCPTLEANIGDACDDLDASTDDDTVNDQCVCIGTPIVVYDCPTLEANIGDDCDDLDGSTDDDTVNDQCVCIGTPIVGCTGNEVVVSMTTDAQGEQLSWTIMDAMNGVVATGGPYTGQNNTTVNTTVCLPTNFGDCYRLRLTDSFGDGISGGSWEVRDTNGDLVIGDAFASGVYSPPVSTQNPAYGQGHTFCLPLGGASIDNTSCGVFTNIRQSKVFCSEVPGATTYQFEFSDPDAGFFRRIAVPRNWVRFSEMYTNPLQPGVVYFVRARV
ncbi:MAG TPA: hypothetical protein VGE21_03245, partial [Flavobacteriales bacterium]